MVKLVTSRLHRCYSAIGNARSARHERINDCMHLAAVSLLLASVSLELPQLANLVTLDRHKVALVGAALLVLTQLFDLFATSTAHRMHYVSSRRMAFVATATKVDALVAICLLLGAVAELTTAKLATSPRAQDALAAERLALLAALALVTGTLCNAIFALPSLVVKLQPTLARTHNAVVSLFLVGTTGKAVVALLYMTRGNGLDAIRPVLAVGAVAAHAALWGGAILNVARTGALLEARHRGREALSDDSSTKSRGGGGSGGGGLFSWFQKKEDTGGESDYSDMDEEDGYSTEEESYNRRKSRR